MGVLGALRLAPGGVPLGGAARPGRARRRPDPVAGVPGGDGLGEHRRLGAPVPGGPVPDPREGRGLLGAAPDPSQGFPADRNRASSFGSGSRRRDFRPLHRRAGERRGASGGRRPGRRARRGARSGGVRAGARPGSGAGDRGFARRHRLRSLLPLLLLLPARVVARPDRAPVPVGGRAPAPADRPAPRLRLAEEAGHFAAARRGGNRGLPGRPRRRGRRARLRRRDDRVADRGLGRRGGGRVRRLRRGERRPAAGTLRELAVRGLRRLRRTGDGRAEFLVDGSPAGRARPPRAAGRRPLRGAGDSGLAPRARRLDGRRRGLFGARAGPGALPPDRRSRLVRGGARPRRSHRLRSDPGSRGVLRGRRPPPRRGAPGGPDHAPRALRRRRVPGALEETARERSRSRVPGVLVPSGAQSGRRGDDRLRRLPPGRRGIVSQGRRSGGAARRRRRLPRPDGNRVGDTLGSDRPGRAGGAEPSGGPGRLPADSAAPRR